MRWEPSVSTEPRPSRPSRPPRSLLLVVLLLAAVLPSACSHPGKGLETGSFERGLAEFEGERWFDAVESLKLFVRRNPTDPRVDEAQYLIGLARFEDEDYPVAAVEFEILRKDYPSSPRVEDAWYMEGRCYVKQVPPIHLEQAVTRKALDHFRAYFAEFPSGERRAEMEREARALQRHLDEKDLATVRLYRKLGKPEAALISLDVALEERPTSELRPQMLFLAGELHRELEQEAEARASWDRLVNEFPEHELAQRAQRALRGLATTPVDPDTVEGDGR